MHDRGARLLITFLVCCTASMARAGESRALVALDPADATAEGTLLGYAVMQALAASSDTVVLSTDRGGKDEIRLRRERDQAAALLINAREQFDMLELQAAVRDYGKAMQKLEKVAELSRDVEPLLRCYSMTAATHLLLEQVKRAKDHLTALITLDPSYVPDQSVFNPQMLDVVESVRRDLTALPRGELVITVEPTGSVVIVDGKVAGLAPVTVPNLLPGRHYVLAVLPGFESEGRPVTLGSTSMPLSLTLEKARKGRDSEALVSAAVQRAGAEVTAAVQKLAQGSRADEVLILSRESGVYSLVRYGADGAQRAVNTVAGAPSDVETATRMSQALLGPSNQAAAKEVASADRSPTLKPTRDGSGLFSNHHTKNTVLWGLYGGAAGAALVGGTFGLLAVLNEQRYARVTRDSSGRIDHKETTDQIEAASIERSGKRDALLADVFVGLALAAVASGVALHIAWHPGAPTPSASMGPGAKADGFTAELLPNGFRLHF
jgi:hypothetical protein